MSSGSGWATRTTGTFLTGSALAPLRWMVLPDNWALNWDAPMTVARMRWPGSMTGRPLRAGSRSVRATARSLAMSPWSLSSWPNRYSATPPEKVR